MPAGLVLLLRCSAALLSDLLFRSGGSPILQVINNMNMFPLQFVVILNNEEVSRIYGKNLDQPIETPSKETDFQVSFIQSKDRNKTHYLIFRQAMKYTLTWGQCWGLIPVVAILDENPLNVRFKMASFRFAYSLFVWIVQLIATCFSFNYLISTSLTISGMASLCFCASTCTITFLSMCVASKWPALIQEVANSNLNVNPRIKFKCTVAFFSLIALGVVEHSLSIISNVATTRDCFPEKDVYRSLVVTSYLYIFKTGVLYSLPLGIFLQYVTILCTINWCYSDILIICISIYLTSVLEEINEKIRCANKRETSSSYWRCLRQEYTRATHLVRQFDDAINSIIFVSFATNLFFICLQLFHYILANGMQATNQNCPNFPSGPFCGYESSIYFTFSLCTVVLRALSVALFTSDVHYASLAPAPALYEVPHHSYCEEVQRFIEQVHSNNVALSGLEFFFMTRELILSVAGAIVTYELVLLQFQGENMISTSEHNPGNLNVSTVKPGG